ncbi:extracellular solute-binding protein [Cohnella sp. WQ 127256]|uniref:extracellular solute-binding protein n=1 Tax=Cohnella sp. WQ 127256 TaxID=2938790 RepID=UPI002117B354|nr:extracellular solute-binding protein [Cohnella sp. WQ 127256]
MKVMNRKKWLAIGLTGAMAFSLVACSGNEKTEQSSASASSQPTSTESSESVAADPMGKYDPPIEITAVRPITEGTKFKEGESIDNNNWSKAYQESLGIKIKYNWTIATAQYDQKLNIAIASDDLPDVMEVNAAQLKRLVEDDQLEDLSSLYDQYAAPFTKEVLSQDGGNALKSGTFDGKQFALPKMGSGLGQTHVLWIRTDWLKKLQLSEPKTIDDVLKIAEAFTKQDPDGNKKDDTRGLGINKDIWGFYAAMEGFFNGFHAYPNVWVKDESGKLAYGSIQPQMKNALQKLQELYKAGQIDKEFGTKDASKVNEEANAGKLGMFYGYFWNSGWLQDGKLTNPEMEWTPYPLPSIDDQPAKAQVPFAINTYYVVKKGAKHPEASIKMLNLVLENIYGATANPEAYNVDKDGIAIFEYALLYGEAPRKNLDAHLNVMDALTAKDDSKLTAEEKGYYSNIMAYQGGDNQFWGSDKMYGEKGSLSVIEGYFKNQSLMNDEFFGAPTQTMIDNNATLQKLQLETFTRIIMGDSIDKFDEYVKKWKQLGGDEITKELNEWALAQK